MLLRYPRWCPFRWRRAGCSGTCICIPLFRGKMLAKVKRQVLSSNAKKNVILRIWKEDYKKQKAFRRPEETKNTVRLSDHFAGNQKNPVIKITGCMKQNNWETLRCCLPCE